MRSWFVTWRWEANWTGNVTSMMLIYTYHSYLLQLNIHIQVYCDIKQKLHLHMYITVVWHLSYPLSTHTQTHSLSHLHTHSAPWGRLWGRCSESKVKQWGCKTEKRVERLTPLFPSRPARPIFKMLMPGAQTHSEQFIWSFSRKTLWSLKQLNWQLKEYWDTPKQTQPIATLNLCGTHTSVSVSFYLCFFEEYRKNRNRKLKSFWWVVVLMLI